MLMHEKPCLIPIIKKHCEETLLGSLLKTGIFSSSQNKGTLKRKVLLLVLKTVTGIQCVIVRHHEVSSQT